MRKYILALYASIIASGMVKDMEPSERESQDYVVNESMKLAYRLLKESERFTWMY